MQEKTIPIFDLNLYGLIISTILLAPVIFVFFKFYDFELFSREVSEIKIIIFSLLCILSIMIHECIHALFFLVFSKGKIKSVKIGFFYQYLTPYAHCSESLSRIKYGIALIGPFVILGLLPIIISFGLQSVWILFYGSIMTVAASGDLIILYHLIKVPKGKTILDHDKKAGFWIV